MRTRRLGAALVIAAALTCASTSCAVIPVGGPFPIEEAGGGDPMSKPFQRIVAVKPQPDWQPPDIVTGLQVAMAAYPDDAGVLPDYLTPEAQKKWKPSGAVTVVDHADDLMQTQVEGKADEVNVTMKATPVAIITDEDQYKPIQSAKPTEYVFTLTKGPAGWRVKTLPGQGLLLTRADVERAYRGTNLYYLNGPTSPDRLVADRVWLRIKPTESFAQTIVQRLIKGPSQALQGAVDNEFPQKLRVESIRVDDRVVVNFTGDDIGGVDLRGLEAQLRFSLNSNNMANGRDIEIQYDGEPFNAVDPVIIRPKLDDDWLDTGGGQAYYVAGGSVRMLPDDQGGGPGSAIPGPAGQQNSDVADLAISARGEFVAARSKARGGIWVTPSTVEGHWQQWFPGTYTDLTPPTWSRDGSLWTYDRKQSALLKCDAGCANGAHPPAIISAPGLANADVRRLKIARDGVRVAAVIGTGEVRVGALTNGDGMLGNIQSLIHAAKAEEITDLAWRSGEDLLVLVSSQSGKNIKDINVGDGTVEPVLTDKRDLKTIAAYGDHIYAGTDKLVLQFSMDSQSLVERVKAATSPLFALG